MRHSSTYNQQKLILARRGCATMVIDNPYMFIPCLFDVPLKTAADALGVGVSRLVKINRMLHGNQEAKWPCEDVYLERHQYVSRDSIIRKRDEEIRRMTGAVRNNARDLNLRGQLTVLKSINESANRYGVMKGCQLRNIGDAVDVGSVNVGSVNAESAEEIPVPAAELPFYCQFNLDALFEDELGLGPIPAIVLN